MKINKILWISEQPPRADKSAMGTINRPLHWSDALFAIIRVLPLMKIDEAGSRANGLQKLWAVLIRFSN